MSRRILWPSIVVVQVILQRTLKKLQKQVKKAVSTVAVISLTTVKKLQKQVKKVARIAIAADASLNKQNILESV